MIEMAIECNEMNNLNVYIVYDFTIPFKFFIAILFWHYFHFHFQSPAELCR